MQSQEAEVRGTETPRRNGRQAIRYLTTRRWNSALLEQIFDPVKKRAAFEVFDRSSGERSFHDGEDGYSDPDTGELLLPITDDLVRKDPPSLLLPSGSVPYGATASLVSRIQDHFNRWFVWPREDDRVLATYYVLFTWVYDRFDEAPYLRAVGDYGVGKSRFMRVVGNLCYHAIIGQGNASAASLYRVHDLVGSGTFVLDEIDFNPRNPDHEEKANILRSGYQREGSNILKQEPGAGNVWMNRAYSVFGPKVLAGRNEIYDKALDSRFFKIVMRSGAKLGAVPHELPTTYYAEMRELRNMLLRWRQDNIFRELREPEPIEVDNRLVQVYRPLARIIEDPAGIETLKRTMLELQNDIVENRRTSREGRMAASLLEQYRDGEGPEPRRILVKAIADGAGVAGPDGVPHPISPKVAKNILLGFGLEVGRGAKGAHVDVRLASLGHVLQTYGLAPEPSPSSVTEGDPVSSDFPMGV